MAFPMLSYTELTVTEQTFCGRLYASNFIRIGEKTQKIGDKIPYRFITEV